MGNGRHAVSEPHHWVTGQPADAEHAHTGYVEHDFSQAYAQPSYGQTAYGDFAPAQPDYQLTGFAAEPVQSHAYAGHFDAYAGQAGHATTTAAPEPWAERSWAAEPAIDYSSYPGQSGYPSAGATYPAASAPYPHEAYDSSATAHGLAGLGLTDDGLDEFDLGEFNAGGALGRLGLHETEFATPTFEPTAHLATEQVAYQDAPVYQPYVPDVPEAAGYAGAYPADAGVVEYAETAYSTTEYARPSQQPLYSPPDWYQPGEYAPPAPEAVEQPHVPYPAEPFADATSAFLGHEPGGEVVESWPDVEDVSEAEPDAPYHEQTEAAADLADPVDPVSPHVAPEPRTPSRPGTAAPATLATQRARSRRTRPSVLSVVGPPAAVVGAAAVAVAVVGGLSMPDAKGMAAASGADAKNTASPLNNQLSALRAEASAVADRASRDQERVTLAQDQAQALQAARQHAEAVRPKFLLPIQGDYTLTAGFGQAGDHWMNLHTGQDFAVPTGTPVHAVTDGTVTEAGWLGPYGYAVVITAKDGTQTWYCHLSQIKVRSGPVKAGEVLALSGATGNVTGPHLHLEVRIDGTPVDPLPWLRDHGLSP